MHAQPNEHDPAAEAADWAARLDRTLSPQEQDEYLQWLQRDPRNRQAIAHLTRTWTALDTLALWQPAEDAHPNPDVLAPPRGRRRWLSPAATGALVAIGAVAVAILISQPTSLPEPPAAELPQSMRIIPGPERRTLADASILEVREASRYELAFDGRERRVVLLDGEFHVQVTPDPTRPCLVEADGVKVRAIGTAFAVRRQGESVEVLVTEGKVQVETPLDSTPPLAVTQGERAAVRRQPGGHHTSLTTVSALEIERALAWQGAKLEFDSVPLAAVIVEFNLRNKQQLVLGDREAGLVRVAGSFRADNVAAFTRLLEASFDIQVERPPEGAWILRSAR